MPSGFFLMILSVILDRRTIGFASVFRAVTSFPAIAFFILWILLIIYMIWLAGHMEQSDAKVNWKEQFINSAAQLAFLLGILYCVL